MHLQRVCLQMKILAELEGQRCSRQREAFCHVKERLQKEVHAGSVLQPRLALSRALEIRKKVGLEKGKLDAAEKNWSSIVKKHQTLLTHVRRQHSRLEIQESILRDLKRRAAACEDLQQAESQFEDLGPYRRELEIEGVRSDKTDGGFVTCERSLAEVMQGADQTTSLTQMGQAHTPQSGQEAKSQAGAREGTLARSCFDEVLGIEELKARIEEMCTWHAGARSGVALDYITRHGRRLHLRVMQNSAGEVEIQIFPEYYCDRRALWNEKEHIAAELVKLGMAVRSVRVMDYGAVVC